ncbi:DUF4253 domain-containing protein [Streptomyces sp. RerS4]|uniref:DUF4253 domain-containing protein n=1 Tax=Streptomyces sp. RerS4 TaxID=2942449 RepID=UPI00201C0830|nr:DUF4253 domain-containing protein [Streptomyces sp. RerS4]UQX01259.1 DUF4253 domain-containing protein [Streptomyces sp. RerS4]
MSEAADPPRPSDLFGPLRACADIPGLPPGTVITRPVRRRLRRARRQPLLWVSDGPVDVPAAAWAAPAGLTAVLLHDRSGLEEWWHTRALDPGRAGDPDDHDAETVLREYWDAVIPDPAEGAEGEELIAPFGRDRPPLAPPGTPTPDADAAADAATRALLADGWLGRPRLALVPAARRADVPAAIGWSGPCNHDDDTARISAVLRSWEERYDARVLAIGFDRLDLYVAAPPRTPAEALAVAAEHFAFCPDNVWQGSGTVAAYAEEAVVGQSHWSFWWD